MRIVLHVLIVSNSCSCNYLHVIVLSVILQMLDVLLPSEGILGPVLDLHEFILSLARKLELQSVLLLVLALFA